MRAAQSGLTFIELMIVVAIIGFLATVLVPGYQAYSTRAQIAEVLVIADTAKTTLSEYYMTSINMPNSGEQANINLSAAQSQYVDSISFSTTSTTATIVYTIANISGDADLAFYGEAESDGSISWVCNSPATTLPNQFLPQICRK